MGLETLCIFIIVNKTKWKDQNQLWTPVTDGFCLHIWELHCWQTDTCIILHVAVYMDIISYISLSWFCLLVKFVRHYLTVCNEIILSRFYRLTSGVPKQQLNGGPTAQSKYLVVLYCVVLCCVALLGCRMELWSQAHLIDWLPAQGDILSSVFRWE